MSHETLLIDLCAICHVNVIKYTCPRCSIHTCSLPCVKKHKARAQCSGVRNPAEYRKRADLATSSSIDKDFNFITSIERSVTKADENVLDRGLHLAPARQLRPVSHRPKIDVEIEERGVRVTRAPKGLSRSKQNKTHWVNQQKSVMWTIEWILLDGEKITGAALEKRSIAEVYAFIVGKKKTNQKRRLSHHETVNSTNSPQKAARKAEQTTQQTGGKDALEAQYHTQVANQNHTSTNLDKEEPHASSNLTKDITSGLYFYLNDPVTSAKLKCLIPLSEDQTLRTALEGRTVLEYPTLYALTQAPSQLKEPFISSEEYEKRYGSDIPIPLSAPLEDGEVEESQARSVSSMFDAPKVIEVLARDLAG